MESIREGIRAKKEELWLQCRAIAETIASAPPRGVEVQILQDSISVLESDNRGVLVDLTITPDRADLEEVVCLSSSLLDRGGCRCISHDPVILERIPMTEALKMLQSWLEKIQP